MNTYLEQARVVGDLLQLGHGHQLRAERALVALHKRGVELAEQHRAVIDAVPVAIVTSTSAQAAGVGNLVAALGPGRPPGTAAVAGLLRPVLFGFITLLS